MNNKFKISVVTAVYNTEKYIEETIVSVLNQDIGFRNNVQLILVNDGSNDNSLEICSKYQKKYPKNIFLINKKNNEGVSVARNDGLKIAKGKYVTFLDSDDKYSSDTFSEVFGFFESTKNETDVVAIKQIYFEKVSGEHPLNYRFKGNNRIVDLRKEFDFIQMSLTSAFIRRTALKNKSFFVKLKISEDARLVTEILLNKLTLGVCTKPMHYYRRRNNSSSAIQTSKDNITWYTDTLTYFFDYIINLSREKYGKVIKYIQYLVLYDLQWRLKVKGCGPLSLNECTKYKSHLSKILRSISKNLILKSQLLQLEYKVFALSLRSQKSPIKFINELVIKDDTFTFGQFELLNFSKTYIHIQNLSIKNQNLHLDFVLKNSFIRNSEDFKIYYKLGNVKQYIQFNLIKALGKVSIDTTLNVYGASLDISLKKIKKSLLIFILESKRSNKKYQLNIPSPFISKFFVSNKYILNFNTEKYIYIRSYNVINHIFLELRYALALIKNLNLKILIFRIFYYFAKIWKYFLQKEVWIISDRVSIAGDNGEAFFKYTVKSDTLAHKVFAITKNSLDFDKIKNIGNVVDFGSFKHKILFLIADKVISSHFDRVFIDLFLKESLLVKDLYKFDFIFLQHGVTKDDLSKLLNKFIKNLRLFITVSQLEQKSIIEEGYNYSVNEVKLTGFPRYDLLNKKYVNKKILLTPTWRLYLAGKQLPNGSRAYNEEFIKTKYFKFYNNFINNKKLHKILEEYEVTLDFCLHPLLINQAEDFKNNKYVNISKEVCDYKKSLNECSLLITDYSSTIFDVAYMYKPVIYAHYDEDEFFDKHTYSKGYFSYKNDGFGPIVNNVLNLVDYTIKYVENNFKMDHYYIKRVDKFFKYHDKQNSKRVYEEIIKLNNK